MIGYKYVSKCLLSGDKRLVINFNDRGAQLDGVTLIHPDAFPEMRSALEESLKSFSPKDETLLQQRRSLNRHGLTQILNNLTIKCDLIWKSMPSEKDETKVVSEKLLELFSDREISCLLGDFSFSIMPKIAKGKTISQKQSVEIAIKNTSVEKTIVIPYKGVDDYTKSEEIIFYKDLQNYFYKIGNNREFIMCVICNLTTQGYEAAYLAVETDASESIILPVVNRLLDYHSFMAVDSMLIQASLVGIIL